MLTRIESEVKRKMEKSAAEEDAVHMDVPSVQGGLSKFSLSRLALKSALELEKAKLGQPYSQSKLESLAEALSQTSPGPREGVTFRAVKAGFHRPFVRLFRDRRTADPKSLQEIQRFLAEIAAHLHGFKSSGKNPEEAEQLIAFCTSLHRELVHGLSAENRVVLRQRKTPRAVTPRLGSAAT